MSFGHPDAIILKKEFQLCVTFTSITSSGKMNKGYIYKLSFRPYTLEQACRVRYYVKTCALNTILQACEDMNLHICRVFLNCEPVAHPMRLDVEQPTIYAEVQEISNIVHDPIYNTIAGACGSMTADLVLNISVSFYDRNQLIITHEVYKQ